MNCDVLIIGGGIVGLATAFQLLKKHPNTKLILIEKENALGIHQTGNNSGVIHSGIYYHPGSLKALNCVRGYRLFIEFCKENEVPFEQCGKLIVASSDNEKLILDSLFERGTKNGLNNIKKLSPEELKEYEPHTVGTAGLFVPQTGIVDYAVAANKYGMHIAKRNGDIRLNEKVIDLKQHRNTRGTTVVTNKTSYSATVVVNCAGLYSDSICRMEAKNVPYRIIPFRGEYYKIKKEKKDLVRNLIYPVPNPQFPFLGIHFTRMIQGDIEIGPNAALAFRKEGYKKHDVHLSELASSLTWPGFWKMSSQHWKTGIHELYLSYSKKAFVKAARKLLPEIRSQDITRIGSGVRAQACDKYGNLIDDFLILENRNTINVCNVPSPAATASLAIGETIVSLIEKKINQPVVTHSLAKQ